MRVQGGQMLDEYLTTEAATTKKAKASEGAAELVWKMVSRYNQGYWMNGCDPWTGGTMAISSSLIASTPLGGRARVRISPAGLLRFYSSIPSLPLEDAWSFRWRL